METILLDLIINTSISSQVTGKRIQEINYHLKKANGSSMNYHMITTDEWYSTLKREERNEKENKLNMN